MLHDWQIWAVLYKVMFSLAIDTDFEMLLKYQFFFRVVTLSHNRSRTEVQLCYSSDFLFFSPLWIGFLGGGRGGGGEETT